MRAVFGICLSMAASAAVFAVCLWGGAAVAAEPQVPLSGTLVIKGAGDSRDLLQAIARSFEKRYPGTKIEFPLDVGIRRGLRASREDRVELVRLAGSPRDEQEEGLEYKIFAYSPVVFIVNPEIRNIDNITSEEAVALFMGRLVNWKQLGGTAHRVYPVNREAANSSRLVLEERLPGFKEAGNLTDKTFYTTSDSIESIAQHKGAVGYAPISAVRKSGFRVLSLDGTEPSLTNIRNGSYSMGVSLGIAHGQKLRPLARAFVDFLYGTEARRIIEEHGCIEVYRKVGR